MLAIPGTAPGCSVEQIFAQKLPFQIETLPAPALSARPHRSSLCQWAPYIRFCLVRRAGIYNNYSMSPSWIWSDKITKERVARVGYNHFISNKGEWNICFSKFSNRVLPPIFISTILQSVRKELGALFSIWCKTSTIASYSSPLNFLRLLLV